MEPDYQTGIIGAGFGGIIAALKLLQSGRTSFVIFERASDIGGTWRDNTYPGCACDVPSVLYTLRAAPNPDWSRRYAAQPEILEYLKNVVSTNNLHAYLRLNAAIVHMKYLEQHGLWQLTDQQGHHTTVRTVISAVGPFQSVKLPDVKGLEEFKGQVIHSARWNKNIDLKGKRVAVVGPGASGIQIAPAIAGEVAQLTVFQRTPAWVASRFDSSTPTWMKKVFRYFPTLQSFFRKNWYRFLEYRGQLFFGHQRRYRFFEKLSLKKLEREVADPVIRRQLTPDYRMGCKRILISDDYWPIFNQPHVSLETAGIEQLTPNGIRTKDGQEHPFDVIIFATGFEVIDYDGMHIIGRQGRLLYQEWQQQGIAAYKGTIVSGFPNLCFLLGPNTGFGHISVLLAMEAQMDYILQYLELLEKQQNGVALDVKPEVQHEYNRSLQQRFKNTVWASGCQSWYLDAQGNNPVIYPGLMTAFRKEMRAFRPSDYQMVYPERK